jgi:hypothetical protein
MKRIFSDAQEATVGLGKAGNITVGLNRLTDEVVEHIFAYGLKQLLNDCHASEKEPANKLALVQKKLENLYDGKITRASGGGRTSDPVAQEAKRLAKAKIKTLTSGQLRELTDRYKDDEGIFAAFVEHFRPQAQRNVDDLAVEIDL